MVEYKTQQLNHVFHALADPTRREMLQRIAIQPCSVSKLAEPYDLSLNAISKHLKVLEQAHLVKRIRKGRMHYFVFNQQALTEASALMTQLQEYWNERLNALEEYFKSI